MLKLVSIIFSKMLFLFIISSLFLPHPVYIIMFDVVIRNNLLRKVRYRGAAYPVLAWQGLGLFERR